jgi:polar amino acid transport system substrate-binding protein
LQAHPRIVLGTEKSWEPYVVVDQQGHIAGYDSDVLARINALTGAHFELQAGVWREMQEAARQRRIDGLSTGGISPERRLYLDFSDVYIALNKMLLVKKGNPKGLRSRADLSGMRIAIHRGNQVDERLAAQFPNSRILALDTPADVVRAVVEGSADALFDNGTHFYLAQKLGLPYLEIAFDLGDRLELAFGVRNDWPLAVSILNKGLRAIPTPERIQMQQRWFLGMGGAASLMALSLSADEQAALRGAPVRVCVPPMGMPLGRLDAQGQPQGSVLEVQQQLAAKLGVTLQWVVLPSWRELPQAMATRRCDLVAAAVSTASRRHFLSFTRSFMDIALVVAARDAIDFVENEAQLQGRSLAVVQGSAAAELLRQNHPALQVVEMPSAQAAFDAVQRGTVFGFVDTAVAVNYAIRQGGLNDIRIVGKLAERYELAVGVRPDAPLLLSAYDKALTTLAQGDLQRVQERWSAVQVVHETDFQLAWRVGALALLLLLLVLYRNRVIAGYNRKLQDASARLQDLVQARTQALEEAGQLALAMQQAQAALTEANTKLAALAITDGLTGLANRRHFDDVLASEWARARRNAQPLALLMIDVDWFKRYNDRYGHQAGDDALVAVARVLQDKARRAGDLAARYGGEEFVVIAPHTPLAQACELAEEVVHAVAALALAHADARSGVLSVSVGVATRVPQEQEDPSALLRHADLALYRAKTHGRNRVEISGEAADAGPG